MTKKKNSRQKHQKDVSFADTTDEELSVNVQGKSCPHVQRGIHFGRVKKSLKSTQSIQTCNGCPNENSEELPEVWLCLQCGYTGCGRTSENKHALQHFKTIHSDCHSLVLSTSSGIVWCYDCDDEISLQSSNILKQCVEFVMKMTPSASNKTNVNRAVAQQKLQNSVIKEETTVKNSEETESIEKPKKAIKNIKESPEKASVKGLRNLGNTCFFNAVMQNLNQTSLLYNELENTCTPSHLWEVPELVFTDNEVTKSENGESLKLSLPRQLSLTNSLFNFCEQMSAKSSIKVDIVNPSPLFGEISKKCPQFRHFQQQDSHELLRQLLDGVRQEEIKRQKKAILRYFELENVSPEDVDEDLKRKCKAYGCYASHSIIEKVFGGLLISTVLCEECKMSSQIFEPFMDLSLPLFEEKQENNEQLCAMLDGGKQDHKPLRNRKLDFDADEEKSGEYILTKPKNEPGKPSKHQEKRQKLLAKKEKKRAKSARNRKNSQTEVNDGSMNVPFETTAVAEDEETGKDSDEEDSVIHDQQKENHDELDLLKPSEDHPVCETSSVDNENEICDPSTSEQGNIENVNHLEPVEVKVEGIEADGDQTDNPFEPGGVQVNSNENSSACLQSKIGETDKEAVVEIKEVISEEDEVNGIEDILIPLAADRIEMHIDSDKESEHPKEINDEFGINACEESSDTISNLTKEFNCFTISESNECSLDDRIQALTMQVKDVRIRRDSDRQESILNSSESADDCESQVTYCTSPKSSIEDTCSNENGDNWSHSVSEQQTKEWILKSLTTLKPRHHVSPLECSINSCLSHFTKPELLTGNNKFRCEDCTEFKIKKTGNKKDVAYSNASKQILIFSPPAVLTLHLKRFQQVGMSLRKVNRFVEFPLILDLAPFCSSACVILPHMASVENEILYSLYGIVEHSGRLTSGHYTAYVKTSKQIINRTFECQVPLGQCNLEQLLHKYTGGDKSYTDNSAETSEEKRQWFYISDSHVKEVSEAQVLKCQAYLLFYERIK